MVEEVHLLSPSAMHEHGILRIGQGICSPPRDLNINKIIVNKFTPDYKIYFQIRNLLFLKSCKKRKEKEKENRLKIIILILNATTTCRMLYREGKTTS